MEQGRDVSHCPVRSRAGCRRARHRLIRDVAKLVETVDDILEELGPLAAARLRETMALRFITRPNRRLTI